MTAVTAQAPAFLAVVLHHEVALEALDAKVYEVRCAFVLQRNLAGEEQFPVGVGVLGDLHNHQELFHRLHVQLEILELLIEDIIYVVNDATEVDLTLGNEFTALLDVASDLGKHKFWVYLAVAFDKRIAEWSRDQLSARVF